MDSLNLFSSTGVKWSAGQGGFNVRNRQCRGGMRISSLRRITSGSDAPVKGHLKVPRDTPESSADRDPEPPRDSLLAGIELPVWLQAASAQLRRIVKSCFPVDSTAGAQRGASER